MKYWLALGLCLTLLGLAEGYKRLVYVRYDPEKGMAFLSSGEGAPAGVTPGQFLAQDKGGLKALPQWRPPQDIEAIWSSKTARRVVFSHERHFAALGAKHCETCHADEKGLGKNPTWPSLAPSADLEPHRKESLGRFCSTCHDGKTSVASLPHTKPPIALKMFSAMGQSGGTCDRCHAPSSHGPDFTAIHSEFAENGSNCTSCHRGGAQISQRELGQALSYAMAQLKLTKDPEDQASFQKTLPNHFCAYCHAGDTQLWQGK